MSDNHVEAVSLTDLVAYQPGNVVSRTLLSSKGGNLTLFAFAAGEGLSEHMTPHAAQVIIVDGAATITIDDQAYELGVGDTLPLPAGIPHAVAAPVDMKMLLVLLKG